MKQGTRAAWGSITRDQVVETAERWVRAGRFDELTIRGLAAELGVAPMSLYRHVRDKDDIVEQVVDRLLARRWRPRCRQDEWMVWIAESARRLRDFLVSEPAALHIYLRHPVVTPAAMHRMEAVLGVLSSAGFDGELARAAYGTIHTYTIGFAALEASRSRGLTSPSRHDETVELLASFTRPQQFDQGLSYLLEGIERRRVAEQ